MTKKLMKVKKSGPAAKELADALGLPRIKGDWWLLLCEDGAGQRFTLAGGQSGQSPMLGGPLNGASVGCGGPFPFLAVGWPHDWEDEVTWLVHESDPGAPLVSQRLAQGFPRSSATGGCSGREAPGVPKARRKLMSAGSTPARDRPADRPTSSPRSTTARSMMPAWRPAAPAAHAHPVTLGRSSTDVRLSLAVLARRIVNVTTSTTPASRAESQEQPTMITAAAHRVPPTRCERRRTHDTRR